MNANDKCKTKKNEKHTILDIPDCISRFLPPEKDFIKLITSCAEDSPDFDGEYFIESIDRITGFLLDIIDRKTRLYRSITIDDYEGFKDDVSRGKNGLGMSWSFIGGNPVEGSDDDRYLVTMTIDVPSLSAVDVVSTYCHDQFDYSTASSERDDEIVLAEGGKVILKKIEIQDRDDGISWEETFDKKITISDEH